jgi:K(+)-stimulated pyrophosphate-energized sodium pump
VTIAVDSYGPVTDNAQSVYELSTIESIPGIREKVRSEFGFDVDFEKAKHNLEENDGAGNTFKATAKPVLIGTAVVGATTMIFSIIVGLDGGLQPQYVANLSLLHAPFLLGLITGGAVIYWFTGASTQAVTAGAYRAVEFIKANIKLEGVTKASVADSKKVVAICTQYAQKGMFNIFLAVFFGTLPSRSSSRSSSSAISSRSRSSASTRPSSWPMRAAPGTTRRRWSRSCSRRKGRRSTTLRSSETPWAIPFKDTSSVAMNPVIKFTTLFGLLAVDLAVSLTRQSGATFTMVLAAIFLAISMTFVWRSFYAMRITPAK